MASIIPGYEYDIFVSYRQKDNKYDGWVTEFVDNLKREIDATFKEDVSIYFDENPHDGLLEIHNVDKSLETKLKAVVFLPIISQTYCDPKSFAWQNEFVAFNRMAGEDQVGKDIKLASGNVCSRIIPVKIHELDSSDTELVEKEMGCRLRSIEFIYSSSGVNRPLKPDDNPERNLNKTFYRDQINKVANSIKDVIYGLHPDPGKRATKSYQTRSSTEHTGTRPGMTEEKSLKARHISPKIMVTAALGTVIILALIFILPKLFRKGNEGDITGEAVSKSIAILPVSNLTGNDALQFVADIFQDDIIGKLGTISRLNVRPKPSTLQFRDSKESIQQMAKKLSVNNMVETSMKGTENNIQFEVRLIEAFPEEKYLWSKSFNADIDNLAEVYQAVIPEILNGIKIRITTAEAGNLKIVQNHDPALRLACEKGNYYMNLYTAEGFEEGLKYYNQAISIDPSDPLPYLGLALGYSNTGHVSPVADDASNRAKAYARKALELDSTLADAYSVLATKYLYTDWNFPETEKSLKAALRLNPNLPAVHYTYGWYLMLYDRYDEAEAEMKKAVEIDPIDPLCQGYLAWFYLAKGDYETALAEARKTLQLDPNYTMAYFVMGSAYSEMGMHFEAIEMHKKGLSISPGYESGLGVAYANAGQKENALAIAAGMEKNVDKWYAWALAEIYASLGDKDKAIYYLEEAYRLRQDFMPWINETKSLKALANDQRFKEIGKRLNLPD